MGPMKEDTMAQAKTGLRRPEGGMALIDEARAAAIYDAMGPATAPSSAATTSLVLSQASE